MVTKLTSCVCLREPRTTTAAPPMITQVNPVRLRMSFTALAVCSVASRSGRCDVGGEPDLFFRVTCSMEEVVGAAVAARRFPLNSLGSGGGGGGMGGVP
jgi:hypothetical protein